MTDPSNQFDTDSFNQNIVNLYPEYDRDNVDDNPPEATSFAKRFPIGDVVTNDLKKSVTRETTNQFLTNFDGSIGITSVVNNSTNAVINLDKEHSFNSLKFHNTLNGGSGHTDGTYYTEFQKLYVDGNDIWVVGNNRPNSSLLDAYNPDVILAKYTEAATGLSATLNFQKGYAGISGATRADHVTSITKYSDTRFIIGGFTNTNSGNPYDAYLALIDTSGNFAVKRKLASANQSEKVTDIIVEDLINQI